jgi:hypothetical protein
MCNAHGLSIFNWTPEQVKQHELALRYKNAADRAYQREFRMLEQYYKTHCPKPAAPQPAEEAENQPTGKTRTGNPRYLYGRRHQPHR